MIWARPAGRSDGRRTVCPRCRKSASEQKMLATYAAAGSAVSSHQFGMPKLQFAQNIRPAQNYSLRKTARSLDFSCRHDIATARPRRSKVIISAFKSFPIRTYILLRNLCPTINFDGVRAMQSNGEWILFLKRSNHFI